MRANQSTNVRQRRMHANLANFHSVVNFFQNIRTLSYIFDMQARQLCYFITHQYEERIMFPVNIHTSCTVRFAEVMDFSYFCRSVVMRQTSPHTANPPTEWADV